MPNVVNVGHLEIVSSTRPRRTAPGGVAEVEGAVA